MGSVVFESIIYRYWNCWHKFVHDIYNDKLCVVLAVTVVVTSDETYSSVIENETKKCIIHQDYVHTMLCVFRYVDSC